MKRSKLKDNNAVRKIIISGVVLLGILSLVILVSALTDNEKASLQSELNNLTFELNNSDYSWLVNYNLTYPYVSVFRENGNDEIGRFESIANENGYKVYLTNLSENESYDIFDLKTGKREKISYKIIQKKIRIDEIRKELNQKGGNV